MERLPKISKERSYNQDSTKDEKTRSSCIEISLPKLDKGPHLKIFRTDSEFLQEARRRKSHQKELEEIRNKFDPTASERRARFQKQCAKFKIDNSKRISRRLRGSILNFENLNLHPMELRAILRALCNDYKINHLNLSSNALTGSLRFSLKTFLKFSDKISELLLDNCSLDSQSLEQMSLGLVENSLTKLSLNGNKVCDKHQDILVEIIENCPLLKEFCLNHNTLEGNSRRLAKSLGYHSKLQVLNLSWNHIRGRGSVLYAKIVEESTSLLDVDFSWNGFGYEGCAALSDALKVNATLLRLNLSSNRVHPPALLELVRGLCLNVSLEELDLSLNPITPSYTSVFLEFLKKSTDSALNKIIMQHIVVDKKFKGVLEDIQQNKDLEVIYELSLPVTGASEEQMMREIQAPSVFNMDPLKLLYMLKEKYRAQDFFRKINKDRDESVSADELKMLFKEAGIPVSKMVIEKIITFMDKDNDGKIDLAEFLEGDRKIRKMSRDVARINVTGTAQDDEFNKYSRSFRKGQVNQLTYKLNISEAKNLLSPITSAEASPRSTPRKLSMV